EPDLLHRRSESDSLVIAGPGAPDTADGSRFVRNGGQGFGIATIDAQYPSHSDILLAGPSGTYCGIRHISWLCLTDGDISVASSPLPIANQPNTRGDSPE